MIGSTVGARDMEKGVGRGLEQADLQRQGSYSDLDKSQEAAGHGGTCL